MLLTTLLHTYVAGREASTSYQLSLTRTIRKAAEAGITDTSHLTPVQVNKMLSDLSRSLSRTTRSNIRRELLTLWRFAFELGETDVFPARIAVIRPDRKPVEAWSQDTLRAMLAAAEADLTRCGGRANPTVRDWLPAWIAIGYDTGLRFTDVYEMTADCIRNGCVSLTARKTGKPLVRVLSGHADRLAEELIECSPDGTLFSWMLTRRRAFLQWRAFLDRNNFRGSSKWLRRSCATYLDREKPGSATQYLQHSAPHLAAMHYIDQSLGAAPAGPPPIR